MDYLDATGQIVLEVHSILRGCVFDQVLDRQRLGGCPSLLVKRSVAEDVDGFDESLLRGNDGDFIRRVCRKYEVDVVPKVLVKVHTRHGHQQISRSDERGIRNAIQGEKAKLTKFKSELPKYPKQTARIYATIACHYAAIGEWRNCIVHFVKAIRVNPSSPKAYLRPLIALKLLVKRPTRDAD